MIVLPDLQGDSLSDVRAGRVDGPGVAPANVADLCSDEMLREHHGTAAYSRAQGQ